MDMENNKTPDSKANHLLEIEVVDTPEHDNPEFGAVSIRLRTTKNSTNVIRLSLLDASELAHHLAEYLK